MIERIDGRAVFGSESALKPSSPMNGPRGDFHSLLKGKLEGFRPLERMIISLLSQALDSFLSPGGSAENGTFPAPPLFSFSRDPAPEPVGLGPAEVAVPEEPSENLPRERNFDEIIAAAGERYGVDPLLIRAVMQTESAGNPLAVSRAGARGLMQIMPGTAEELGIRDSFDPAENILGGTRYLRRLLDRYQGDRKLALAAYNWGMGNVENRLEAMPRETRSYILKVENLYQKLLTA